jgi:hypothetical protein
MSEPVKCFLITASDKSGRYLRRYTSGTKCDVCQHGYHQSLVHIGDFKAILTEDGYESSPSASKYEGDERWPATAPCGYVFAEEDEWQVFTKRIYTDADGNAYTLNELPPGAMYDADWCPWKGPDGRSLVVILPNGHGWCIDHQANNCTIPEDVAQKQHHCWIRHGEPPNITVDKNGITCQAGAGSILTPKWHGFLRNGYLVEV